MDAEKEKLIQLEADVKHIRKDTGDIKESIQVFIAQISNQALQIENLRVRMRNSEDAIKDLKNENKAQNSKIWKISIIVIILASSIGAGTNKILSLFFGT